MGADLGMPIATRLYCEGVRDRGMEITATYMGDILVMRLRGHVWGAAGSRVVDIVRSWASHGYGGLVLNLTECSSLDSLGVGMVEHLVRNGMPFRVVVRDGSLEGEMFRGKFGLRRNALVRSERQALESLRRRTQRRGAVRRSPDEGRDEGGCRAGLVGPCAAKESLAHS